MASALPLPLIYDSLLFQTSHQRTRQDLNRFLPELVEFTRVRASHTRLTTLTKQPLNSHTAEGREALNADAPCPIKWPAFTKTEPVSHRGPTALRDRGTGDANRFNPRLPASNQLNRGGSEPESNHSTERRQTRFQQTRVISIKKVVVACTRFTYS